jgi:hypothetical protein
VGQCEEHHYLWMILRHGSGGSPTIEAPESAMASQNAPKAA